MDPFLLLKDVQVPVDADGFPIEDGEGFVAATAIAPSAAAPSVAVSAAAPSAAAASNPCLLVADDLLSVAASTTTGTAATAAAAADHASTTTAWDDDMTVVTGATSASNTVCEPQPRGRTWRFVKPHELLRDVERIVLDNLGDVEDNAYKQIVDGQDRCNDATAELLEDIERYKKRIRDLRNGVAEKQADGAMVTGMNYAVTAHQYTMDPCLLWYLTERCNSATALANAPDYDTIRWMYQMHLQSCNT